MKNKDAQVTCLHTPYDTTAIACDKELTFGSVRERRKNKNKGHPNHVKYTLIPLVKFKSPGREMCPGLWRSLFSPTDASVKRSEIAAVPKESHLSKMRMHC